MKRLSSLFFVLSALSISACDYETVTAFTTPQTPQSVAIEADGNVVVASSLTGEILRVDPDSGAQSLVAVVPLGQCPPNPLPAIMGALALDSQGDIYVNANTCDPAQNGVWKIDAQTGAAGLHVPLPKSILANGIAIKDDGIFIVDTYGDTLYRAPLAGGPASPFAQSVLLAPNGDVIDPTPGVPGDETPVPGGNGVQRYEDGLVVANSSSGDLVFVDDQGNASVLATSPVGCDDIAVDKRGNVLCTTDAFQQVYAISPTHGSKLIFDGTDAEDPTPLDGPTAVTCKEGGYTCYLTNAAFPFFPGTGFGPSLGKFRWKFPGAPR